MANIAKLSAIQASIINNARQHSSDEERKQIKREVYAVVKAKFGIPQDAKLKAETDPGQHLYLVLFDKQDRAFVLGDNGQWTGDYMSKPNLMPMPQAQAADPVDQPQANTGGTDSVDSFPVAGGAAAALPEGVKITAAGDRTVVIEFDDNWDADTYGYGRVVLTAD